jgi:DNA-binding NtrC family response regulator
MGDNPVQRAKARLLIVDDEPIALRNLERVLAGDGYQVSTAPSGQSALRQLRHQAFDVVLTDLRMEKVDGLQVLKRCKDIDPDAEVILITGYAAIETAIEAMKQGAYHYLAKPFKLEEVRKVVGEAAEKVALKKENRKLRETVENLKDRVDIITQDPGVLRVLDTARDATAADCNILITGESGTGKELIARYVHRHSLRSASIFLAVNCGAFTEELLTSELFGHEKGAFTGAAGQKKGLVEVAHGGTLFLDEVTEMSPSMQVRLLRVIQEKEFIRVGGTEPIAIDVRFIAATNRNLEERVSAGGFREDLFFRLNVIPVVIPPLRERRGDIPQLAGYFLAKHAARAGRQVAAIDEGAAEWLKTHDWPGNVRELENTIERAVALARSERLTVEDLAASSGTRRGLPGGAPERPAPPELPATGMNLEEHLAAIEKEFVRQALASTGGNMSEAARLLGMSFRAIRYKSRKYELK